MPSSSSTANSRPFHIRVTSQSTRGSTYLQLNTPPPVPTQHAIKGPHLPRTPPFYPPRISHHKRTTKSVESNPSPSLTDSYRKPVPVKLTPSPSPTASDGKSTEGGSPKEVVLALHDNHLLEGKLLSIYLKIPPHMNRQPRYPSKKHLPNGVTHPSPTIHRLNRGPPPTSPLTPPTATSLDASNQYICLP